MKEFVFGLYRLEVDVEATRAYYEAHPGPWITCTCDGCRNFARAAGKLPQAVTDFFHTLGLDPEKPGELMYYQGTPETLSGGGWYHLVGRVAEGSSKPGDDEVLPAGWYDLAEGFSVGLKTECDLLPDDFPKPCFQMEFEHVMPWVLNEPNPYIYE
nr:hypothetical protein [uncultured Oscillibacter sp.]